MKNFPIGDMDIEVKRNTSECIEYLNRYEECIKYIRKNII